MFHEKIYGWRIHSDSPEGSLSGCSVGCPNPMVLRSVQMVPPIQSLVLVRPKPAGHSDFRGTLVPSLELLQATKGGRTQAGPTSAGLRQGDQPYLPTDSFFFCARRAGQCLIARCCPRQIDKSRQSFRSGGQGHRSLCILCPGPSGIFFYRLECI